MKFEVGQSVFFDSGTEDGYIPAKIIIASEDPSRWCIQLEFEFCGDTEWWVPDCYLNHSINDNEKKLK